MLLNSRPAPPGSLMASCRPPPIVSISSMKKRTGLRPAACANTPWMFSPVAPIQRFSSFGADTYSKCSPNSPAVALARNVFPVPRGPYKRIPFLTNP